MKLASYMQVIKMRQYLTSCAILLLCSQTEPSKLQTFPTQRCPDLAFIQHHYKVDDCNCHILVHAWYLCCPAQSNKALSDCWRWLIPSLGHGRTPWCMLMHFHVPPNKIQGFGEAVRLKHL